MRIVHIYDKYKKDREAKDLYPVFNNQLLYLSTFTINCNSNS